jgi:hypothetical protein
LKQLCPYCQSRENLNTHIPVCSAISPDSVRSNFAHYRINDQYLCKHCWSIFDLPHWEYHRKKKDCRRSHKQQSFSSKNYRSQPEVMPEHSNAITPQPYFSNYLSKEKEVNE